MADEYDFRAVEARWKDRWIAEGHFRGTDRPDPANKRYVLTMFPYPSGDLHMGHGEIFSIHDAIARFYRMQGHEVLNPIGWDAFGLPAENAAIKRGIHPRTFTYDNIAQHRESMRQLGYSFDWDRTFNTCDPDFYRWNQWFFLRFYERDLAYRKNAPANWCPSCKTVLANEQVIAGHCERCDSEVTRRMLTQWFFRITDYADRLLDDLELNVGWTERLKALQRNWIGRSFGAEVQFGIDGRDDAITVFTTRPDTLWGATFFVIAPEHPMVDELVAPGLVDELEAFRQDVARLSEIDRASTERPKKGMFLGVHAVNPVNGERIPIWTADYVLLDYGTGAIMAVPAHDQRDFDFARAYGLPVRVVIEPDGGHLAGDTMAESHAGPGVMTNSGRFDGTSTETSVADVTRWLEEQGKGRLAKNFRIRDWLISRQRYWGTPIPILFCADCGELPVPEDELPVVLPHIDDFMPDGDRSPLAKDDAFVNVTCPKCGGNATRETDTMDTFVDSSWYFLRYLDASNHEAPFDPAKVAAWMPIDQYTGGITHAVMHLIYARFFQKVLFDMGMVKDVEPFPRLLNQGMVGFGGKAMSKTRGNIVEPREAFERYGADSLRLYMLFSGPPEQDFDWPAEGVTSIGRVAYPWLQRVWRLCDLERRDPGDPALRKRVHQTIKVVTEDYERFAFNTAIARMMELVNDAYKMGPTTEMVESLLLLLAPICPYITEERWHLEGHDTSIHLERWPAYDGVIAAVDEVTMVVQVNGKVRDRITVPAAISEDEMRAQALASARVQEHLGGKAPTKVVTVPPKLVSLVV